MKNILLALMTLSAMFGCNKPEPIVPDPPEEEPIVYYEQCLYRPGDYGSTNWRIPAICCLSDGTLLTVCDKRKYNESDLPEDIDLVVRRSLDNGRTWSEPQTLAEGTGRKQGFGDAALVECANGDVVCVFVGGNGLFASSQADPIRSYVCRSSDKGVTWSEPEDITFQLWGDQATRPQCRSYEASFFGSGNGLRLTRGTYAGRIMFAAAMKLQNNNRLDNFVVYSDLGHTGTLGIPDSQCLQRRPTAHSRYRPWRQLQHIAAQPAQFDEQREGKHLCQLRRRGDVAGPRAAF